MLDNIAQIFNLPQLYNFGELFGGNEFFDRLWISRVLVYSDDLWGRSKLMDT